MIGWGYYNTQVTTRQNIWTLGKLYIPISMQQLKSFLNLLSQVSVDFLVDSTEFMFVNLPIESKKSKFIYTLQWSIGLGRVSGGLQRFFLRPDKNFKMFLF